MNKLGLAVLCFAAAFSVHAQEPAWSGSARCDVSITGPGYTDQQVHTWKMTGGSPTRRGAFDIHAGTWSVTGGGSLERTTGEQTLRAQWTRNVQGMGAPISVVRRASDGAVLIQADHAQLRGRGAVSGTQEVWRGGQMLSSTPISAEAFEQAFPSIKGNSTSTQLTGQTSDAPKGSFGFMQPGNAGARVNCAWDFRRSDYAGGAPPNPATLPPVATPAGSDNAPVATPPTTPASSSCETQLAESRATYEQLETASGLQYAKLLADNARARAALVAERAELRASFAADGNFHPTGNPFAQIDADIARIDAERLALERQKTQAIAAIRLNAASAANAIRPACAAGGAAP